MFSNKVTDYSDFTHTNKYRAKKDCSMRNVIKIVPHLLCDAHTPRSQNHFYTSSQTVTFIEKFLFPEM